MTFTGLFETDGWKLAVLGIALAGFVLRAAKLALKYRALPRNRCCGGFVRDAVIRVPGDDHRRQKVCSCLGCGRELDRLEYRRLPQRRTLRERFVQNRIVMAYYWHHPSELLPRFVVLSWKAVTGFRFRASRPPVIH